MDLTQFKQSIIALNDEEDIYDFCRKTILHGTPHVFKDTEDDFYDFKKIICNHFNVQFYEIYITGSAKLGFSYFKGTQFSLDSDIDIAIISEKLFSEYMDYILEYQYEIQDCKISLTTEEFKKYHKFLKYSAIGWIRPDYLPLSSDIKKIKNDWFRFFDSISNGQSIIGNYQVSAGIFKSYYHFEKYAVSSLNKFKNTLI